MIRSAKSVLPLGNKKNLLGLNVTFGSSQAKGMRTLISKLTNRSLLILQGPETYKLLQGLTTNDITLLGAKGLKSRTGSEAVQQDIVATSQRISLYTLFLSPKGKLITDAFILKPSEFSNQRRRHCEDELWIDVHSSLKRELFFHLKKYMWKKNVELIDVEQEDDQSKPVVYAGYNHMSTISSYLNRGTEIQMKNEEAREGEYANLMMFDPRGGNFGRRIVCMQEQLGLTVKDFEHAPDNDYEDFERTIGYTPSPLSTGKLPFQFNFDLLNAISFKKGCYLGQEIVSRSYFTGIVRRRVFPFIVNNEEASGPEQVKSITEGSVLKNQAGEEVGKVIYYEKGKTGLALAPYLQYFSQEGEGESNQSQKKMLNVKITAPFDGLMYCPFSKELSEYIKDTKKKQQNLEELDI